MILIPKAFDFHYLSFTISFVSLLIHKLHLTYLLNRTVTLTAPEYFFSEFFTNVFRVSRITL